MKKKRFTITGDNWGEIIRRGRQSANLTQEELGKKIGKDKNYIDKLENQKIDPSCFTYITLAKELGYKVFIGDEEI